MYRAIGVYGQQKITKSEHNLLGGGLEVEGSVQFSLHATHGKMKAVLQYFHRIYCICLETELHN